MSTTDASGMHCNAYSDSTYCGRSDDENFTATQQCCVCGGGFKVIFF